MIDWEKIFAVFEIGKELILRIYEELLKEKFKKLQTEKSLLKMGKRIIGRGNSQKRETHMAKDHMKCSASLAVREIQIE